MKKYSVQILLALSIAAGSSLWTPSASASLIWDGDASKGTGVFGNLNCDSPGSVTTTNDATQGRVFRYNKPSGSNRCENHGISVGGSRYVFRNNNTYYFGWRYKLSTNANNNANFQWKSYGNHIQNWPVVLKMVGGRATMIQRQPGNQVSTIWSTPLSANVWTNVQIGLHLSDATRGGWVELYWNGSQQTFNNGTKRYACRLFDSIVEPKWGIYGGENMSMTNFVDGLKVGTTLADVR
jgi:hypothetical protein